MLKEWLEKNHTKLLLDDENYTRQTINNIIEHDPNIMGSMIDYKDLGDCITVHVAWKLIDDPDHIHTYDIKAIKEKS